MFKEYLKEKEEELNKIIVKTEEALKNAPDGSLRISKNRNYLSYYCYKKEERELFPTGRYIRKENFEMAKRLAQKEYDEEILKWAKDCYKRVKKLNNHYEDKALAIYENMPKERRDLVRPYKATLEESIRKWETTPYEGKKINEGNIYFVTDKGEKVRSKSEKILADKFYKQGIPYKYECPIMLNSYGVVYPDFTLFNAKERKVFYWEHLGMMGDMEYVNKAIKKIHTYEKNGIFPGRQLILSYESKNKLDMDVVDALIQEFFANVS